MAAVQSFRTALGGFNREDVVRYIEYINNKHASEVEQLNTQLQTALEQANSGNDSELLARLEAAEARCAELESQLAQNGQTAPAKTGDELEAYRRAERAERLARDRAAQIYSHANAVLADATVKVETISDSVNTLAEQLNTQLQDSKGMLQEAVASLYAIRPDDE